ncbi:MAG: tail fiber domain-containing protein [Bacteroidota bacterium]
MKNKVTFALVAFFCLLMANQTIGQSVIKDIQTTPEQKAIQLDSKIASSYVLEFAGPNNFYLKKQVDNAKEITLSVYQPDGKPFRDGTYKMRVTPIYQMTEAQREALKFMRQKNDKEGIAAFRAEHNLPERVNIGTISFGVAKGKFISPNQRETGIAMPTTSSKWEVNHPSLYASINEFDYSIPNRATDDSLDGIDAQVFATDLIVQGSSCVGFDCATSESFGSDTGRYKENNLRIHFDDTSASASFPQNDWRIRINDTTNGGSEYFAIEDATANRTPFRIDAGAPTNALYVDNEGNVGIGINTPVVEAHIRDGDSPTLRLDQDGSAGFGSQIWDIAGNETNFFIRDVNNSSSLPFRLRPGAPSNSIYIDAQGDIGLGTENPGDNALQVEAGDVYVKSGNVGINVAPSATLALDVLGSSQFTGSSLFTGDMSAFLTTGASFVTPGFSTVLRIDATNTRVGIGKSDPGHLLELSADDAVKPNGGSWTAPSDRRLKTNIVDFTDGLNKVMQIRPVKFHYNGKLGYPTDKEFIGVVAQEMQEVAPYTIKALNQNREGENYLAFDPGAVTYLLVNAVQEQQEIIDAQKEEIENLKAQLSEVAELKQSVAQLTEWMEKQENTASAEAASENTATGEKE